MKYLEDADLTLYNGDALEVLRTLPSESVHMCVTSPPFYGLRDYGTGTWEGGDAECDHVAKTLHEQPEDRPRGWDGGFRNTGTPLPVSYGKTCGKCGATRIDQQIGLEETPEQWVQKLVEVFREVRRVMRHDATLWLECGDSFLPGKQLGGMPWKLAFALQADGWILRSDIVWSRPNPMPESVTDRPTKSHSYVFLLSRSSRYFFDQEAVREAYDPESIARDGRARNTAYHPNGQPERGEGQRCVNAGRNIRSVWTIATQPYPEAHFATYPEELVRRCILAGTSERGCCPECGAPWVREVERSESKPFSSGTLERGKAANWKRAGHARADENGDWEAPTTLGWHPSCKCGGQVLRAASPAPCTVLDPFSGSGTTALVARKHGRRSIGIELSADYCALTARRLQQLSLLAEA